jgi:hypothetical protein
MTVRNVVAVVLGIVFVLSASDLPLAMSSQPEKETAGIEGEAADTPPPGEERQERLRAVQGERKKRVTDNFFQELDGNKNKKVSLDEFLGPMKSRFKSIDGNKDGFITRGEFEASYEQHLKRKMKSMGGHSNGSMMNKMPSGMPPR